ncbi:MAG: hypothetical protein SW833_19880 [Cyanobacteriota bacterium]|nr:hypothetical protein [Cyanobacteriota bacterium]
MTSKKETELLTELLNLEGVEVHSQQQHLGVGIILQVQVPLPVGFVSQLWHKKPEITSEPSLHN